MALKAPHHVERIATIPDTNAGGQYVLDVQTENADRWVTLMGYYFDNPEHGQALLDGEPPPEDLHTTHATANTIFPMVLRGKQLDALIDALLAARERIEARDAKLREDHAFIESKIVYTDEPYQR